MATIYSLLLVLIAVFFMVLLTKALINKKSILNSLYVFFTTGYWFLIFFLVFQISMEIFTEDGRILMSDNSKIFSSNHLSSGFNVPVQINLSFDHKKIYKYNKKDTITGNTYSGSFYKFSDEQKNNHIRQDILKKAGITKQELDSIFEFSPDIEVEGNKLQIIHNSAINKFLKTNTSSFRTKAYLNIKSSNWFFTFCQFVGNYLNLIVFIIIFYQMKSVFKRLKKEFIFSTKLSKKIKWVGLLLMGQQLLTFTLSIFFGMNYDSVRFETINNYIQLLINPRLDFDFTFFIMGLGLIALSTLLEKADQIQQENELTI